MAGDVLTSSAFSRSPHWPTVEKAHLVTQPNCVVCGKSHLVVPCNVHHRYPFHYVVALGRPDLELDHRNLHTICTEHDQQHHILVGHLDDYESFNPELELWINLTHSLTAAQIRAMHRYQEAVLHRPKHLGLMTESEKLAFKSILDATFPKV